MAACVCLARFEMFWRRTVKGVHPHNLVVWAAFYFHLPPCLPASWHGIDAYEWIQPCLTNITTCIKPTVSLAGQLLGSFDSSAGPIGRQRQKFRLVRRRPPLRFGDRPGSVGGVNGRSFALSSPACNASSVSTPSGPWAALRQSCGGEEEDENRQKQRSSSSSGSSSSRARRYKGEEEAGEGRGCSRQKELRRKQQ